MNDNQWYDIAQNSSKNTKNYEDNASDKGSYVPAFGCVRVSPGSLCISSRPGRINLSVEKKSLLYSLAMHMYKKNLRPAAPIPNLSPNCWLEGSKLDLKVSTYYNYTCSYK